MTAEGIIAWPRHRPKAQTYRRVGNAHRSSIVACFYQLTDGWLAI